MNNFDIMFYVSPGASEIRFREYNIENKTTQVFVVLISENNTISYKHGDRIKSTFIVLSSKEAFFHKLKEHGIIGHSQYMWQTCMTLLKNIFGFGIAIRQILY